MVSAQIEADMLLAMQLASEFPTGGPEAAAGSPLEERRALVRAQDDEYQASLERDAAIHAAAEARRRRAAELRAGLAPEPPDGEPAVAVRVRLPCGSALERRFRPDAHISGVRDWVECRLGPGGAGEDGEAWGLAAGYPRVVADPASSVRSVAQGGASVCMLLVGTPPHTGGGASGSA